MRRFVAILGLVVLFQLSESGAENRRSTVISSGVEVYCNILKVNDDNNKSTVRHEIRGYLTYDNEEHTPLKNATVYLLTNKKSIIDSAVTDVKGFFMFKQFNGTYTLSYKVRQKWGGANPKDALLINRYFMSLYTFDNDMKKSAGDVNLDTRYNPIDALLINKRFVKSLDSFPCTDWFFDTNKVVVYNENVIINVKAVCAGDVDGSFIPKD